MIFPEILRFVMLLCNISEAMLPLCYNDPKTVDAEKKMRYSTTRKAGDVFTRLFLTENIKEEFPI